MADVELRVVIQGEDQSQAAVRSLQGGLASVGAAATAAGQATQRATQTGIAGIDRLAAAARRAQGSLQALRSAASAATGAGVGLAAIGAALTAAAFLPIRTAARFERAMSAVNAILNVQADTFEKLSDRARELGATTRFSAVEAAEGMQFLARAGFTATETIDAIGPALNLAAAGALDLAQAADIASNVMAGFGLTAKDVVRITDVLAATAARSNTSVLQLGEAMSFVAPVAAAAGISLEEAAAAMGVMGDAGIQASRAGTGLRGIIAALEAPTNRGKAALARLGVEVQRNADGTLDLTGTMRALNDASLDVASAFDIFRRVAAPAAIAVAKNTENLERLTKSAEESEGAARRMAEIMERNLGGAMIALSSATKEAQIALAQALLPVLKSIVEQVTAAVRFFGQMADRFPRLSALVLGLAGAFGVLTAVLATLLITLGLVGGGLVSLVELIPLVTAKIAANAAAMGILTTAIGIAQAAFLAFFAALALQQITNLILEIQGLIAAKRELRRISDEAAAAERRFALAAGETTEAELESLQATVESGAATAEEAARLREALKVRIQHTGAIVAQKTANQESTEEINKAAAEQQKWIDLLHETVDITRGTTAAQGELVGETVDLDEVTKQLKETVKGLADEYKRARDDAERFGEEAQKFGEEIVDRQAAIAATLRDLRRRTLSAGEAWQDLRRQAQEFLQAAQEARDAGELDVAKENADLAARAFRRLATEVKEGDTVVVSLEQGVAAASEGIRRAGDLAIEVTREQKEAAEENQRKQLEFMESIEKRLIAYKERIEDLPKDIVLSTDEAVNNLQVLEREFDTLVAKMERGVEISVRTTSQLGGLAARAGGLMAQAGGRLTGYGGGDKIKALLEPGEWVIRKEAVKRYGNALFAALNSMKLPRLQLPSLDLSRVRMALPRLPAPAPAFQAGGAVRDAGRTINLNLSFGDGETFPVQGEERIIEGLVRRLRREARVTVS